MIGSNAVAAMEIASVTHHINISAAMAITLFASLLNVVLRGKNSSTAKIISPIKRPITLVLC